MSTASEKAAQDMCELIDHDKFAEVSVSRHETRDYYETIIDHCRSVIDALDEDGGDE